MFCEVMEESSLSWPRDYLLVAFGDCLAHRYHDIGELLSK